MAGTLTPQQREAVSHDGHLLIVAGPGSGKTSTSVARANRILRDPARSIIMVTFTRDAADEMRRRLGVAFSRAKLRVPGEDRLLIGTFHSIAIRHLKRHNRCGRVLSPGQQDALYHEAAVTAGVDKTEWSEVQQEFERIMYTVDQAAAEVGSKARAVFERYQRLVKATGYMDLYTVMRECAINADEGSLPPLPYTDMLVDEGQDTDALQRLWIFAHASAGTRVAVVGDDDQSVYEFRNALGYEGMRSFLDAFRAHRVELADNFRCRQEILASASVLIARNEKRLGKNLVARRGPGGGIWRFQAPSATSQNELLAQLIKATPEAHQEAAVLARTNRSLDMLEIVLRGCEIEYCRVGRSIWQQPVVAGYVGLLRTLVDGTSAGLLPTLQAREVSPDARAAVVMAMGADSCAFLDGTLPASMKVDAEDAEVLREVAKDCGYWRGQLRARAGGLGGSVREVVLEAATQYGAWIKGSEFHRNLLDLCGRILSDLKGPLSARLAVIDRKPRDASAHLTLMTMHGAKGLEFETVHVIDANRPDDVSAVTRPDAERRLMYVALTRAKNCCVVWHAAVPHPTVLEADIELQPVEADLIEAVASTALTPVAA